MSKLKKNWIFLSTLVIFLLTFPKIGKVIEPGIDQSYFYAFNYFFAKGVGIGKEIVFTYGPMGFLMFPQPIGNNLAIGIVVQSFLKLVFILASLKLAFLVRTNTPPVDKLIVFFLVFLMSNFIDFGYLLIFTVAVSLLVFDKTRNYFSLLVSLVVGALALLTQGLYGTVSLLVSVSFLFLKWYKTKKWIYLLLIFLALPFSSLSLWYLIYQDFAGLPLYLTGLMEINAGYNTSMAASSANNLFFLGLSFFLILAIPFISQGKEAAFLYKMFLFPLMVMARHTFLRQDIFHAWYFFDFLILFYLLLLLYSRKINKLVLISMIFSLLSFLGNMREMPGLRSRYFQERIGKLARIEGIINFYQTVANYPTYEKRLKEESSRLLAASIMTPDIVKLIGLGTVDTYPWETSYIAANNFNWKPRPIFQSYVAFTPWLDRQNTNFFLSDKAPEFILWHRDKWGGESESIDGRYLLNDEPSTILAIFSHYNLVSRDDRVALLQRNQKPNFKEGKIIDTTKAAWEEWIEIPKTSGGLLRVKIDFARTNLGEINKILWKEKVSYIEYQLGDRKALLYRLVVNNIPSGVWINPLLNKLSSSFIGDEVRRIRLSNPDSNLFFQPQLRLQWVFYPFNYD